MLRKAVGPYPQISESISKNITAALEFNVLKATFSLLAQMYVQHSAVGSFPHTDVFMSLPPTSVALIHACTCLFSIHYTALNITDSVKWDVLALLAVDLACCSFPRSLQAFISPALSLPHPVSCVHSRHH